MFEPNHMTRDPLQISNGHGHAIAVVPFIVQAFFCWMFALINYFLHLLERVADEETAAAPDYRLFDGEVRFFALGFNFDFRGVFHIKGGTDIFSGL